MSFQLSDDQIDMIEREMDRLGVRQIYDHLVKNGNSPRMAEMLAAQQTPHLWNTDSCFNKKERSRMNEMDDMEQFKINDLARKAGINTTGKTYNGQLGTYTDPAAWVSGTHDVVEAAKKKGLDIDGMVRAKHYKPEKKKNVKMAKDLVDGYETIARRKDPKLDQQCKNSKAARTALRKSIVEKHSSKKGKS